MPHPSRGRSDWPKETVWRNSLPLFCSVIVPSKCLLQAAGSEEGLGRDQASVKGMGRTDESSRSVEVGGLRSVEKRPGEEMREQGEVMCELERQKELLQHSKYSLCQTFASGSHICPKTQPLIS